MKLDFCVWSVEVAGIEWPKNEKLNFCVWLVEVAHTDQRSWSCPKRSGRISVTSVCRHCTLEGIAAKTEVNTLRRWQNQLSNFSCENTLRADRPNTQVLKLSPSRGLWPCSQNFKRVISKSLRWEHMTPIFGTQSISGNWFSSRVRFLIGKPGQGVIRSQRFVIITQWLLCNYQTKRFIGNRHMVWNWWW